VGDAAPAGPQRVGAGVKPTSPTRTAITDPALRVGYERCRRLNAAHGKTYYLATLLLPRAKRPYVHALYGFARYADDIVDNIDPRLPPKQRAARFEEWSRLVRSDLQWDSSADPICRALLDTLRRWQIPPTYVEEFLDAMQMDLSISRYETHGELAEYMRGSAAVIGLQMLPILGRADDGIEWATLEPYAIHLGIAFQLTNFLRDVGEDLRRGRIYLPQESLRRFDVSSERLARGVADRAIRDLVAFEIARTRDIYTRALPGVELVHPTSRACLRTAISLYGGILDEIEQAHYDVFTRRATVPRRRRAYVGATGLLSSWSARRPAAPMIGGRARPRSTT
jgi:phytoene synthase